MKKVCLDFYWDPTEHINHFVEASILSELSLPVINMVLHKHTHTHAYIHFQLFVLSLIYLRKIL